MLDNLRIEKMPSRGFILHKKNSSNEWEYYYSIAGPPQSSCQICGYPLKESEECLHHKGFKGIELDFDLKFAGYYQTDLKQRPTNDITKRILLMRNSKGINYFSELYLLYYSLIKSILEKNELYWGTWIPTRNQILIKIAQKVFTNLSIPIINPFDFIQYDYSAKNHNNRQVYVKEKYKPNKNCPNVVRKTIFYRKGVILDDIVHTCHTMGRILKIISLYSFRKVYCIVLTRTTRGKHPMMVTYPEEK